MSINIKSLCSQISIQTIREKFTPNLTPLEKKIIGIVLAGLACIALAYSVFRCFFKNKNIAPLNIQGNPQQKIKKLIEKKEVPNKGKVVGHVKPEELPEKSAIDYKALNKQFLSEFLNSIPPHLQADVKARLKDPHHPGSGKSNNDVINIITECFYVAQSSSFSNEKTYSTIEEHLKDYLSKPANAASKPVAEKALEIVKKILCLEVEKKDDLQQEIEEPVETKETPNEEKVVAIVKPEELPEKPAIDYTALKEQFLSEFLNSIPPHLQADVRARLTNPHHPGAGKSNNDVINIITNCFYVAQSSSFSNEKTYSTIEEHLKDYLNKPANAASKPAAEKALEIAKNILCIEIEKKDRAF